MSDLSRSAICISMQNMEKKNGKIGFFDSGLGGLTILSKVVEKIPKREYIYLGDNLRAPYGNRSQKEIFDYTLAGVEWLFRKGAELVILACNTASANALRRIQMTVLPDKYPSKRVLGIIIPTAEELGALSKSGHLGVLATKATVMSKTFEKEAKKCYPEIKISAQSGGKLVEIIEKEQDEKKLQKEIARVIDKLMAKDALMDVIILGCTHYGLIKKEIKRALPSKIQVIGQGEIVAKKLANYLARHKEIAQKLSDQSAVYFYTTASDKETKKKMAQFYGEKITVLEAKY